MALYAFRPVSQWVEIRESAAPPVLHYHSSPQTLKTKEIKRTIVGYDNYGYEKYKETEVQKSVTKNFYNYVYDGGELVCSIPWRLFHGLADQCGLFDLFLDQRHYPTEREWSNGTNSKIVQLPPKMAEAILGVKEKAYSRRTADEKSIIWKDFDAY